MYSGMASNCVGASEVVNAFSSSDQQALLEVTEDYLTLLIMLMRIVLKMTAAFMAVHIVCRPTVWKVM